MRPGARAVALSAGIAGALACGYAALGAPGCTFGDAADLAARAARGGPLAPYARSYPLQTLLTRGIAALGPSPARAVVLLDAAATGLAVGVVHAIATTLRQRSAAAACAAAATLAVAHTVWSSAVEAEVYALLVLFVTLAVGAALAAQRDARAAGCLGLVAGLGLLHHRALLPLLPVLACAAVAGAPRGRRVRHAAALAGGALVGALPFAGLVAAEAQRRGVPLVDGAYLAQVLVGVPRNAALVAGDAAPLGASLLYVAKWLAFDLAGPALALAPLGLAAVRRRHGVRGLALAAAACGAVCVLPLRMGGVGDRYVFLTPLLPLLALLCAEGVDVVRSELRRRALALACAATPPLCYAVLAVTPLGARLLPDYDAAAVRRFLLPVRTGFDEPERWARDVLAALPAGAEVQAEWGAGGALEYMQSVRGVRTDVVVQRALGARHPGGAAAAGGSWYVVTPVWRDRAARLPHGVAADEVRPGLFRARPH